MRRWFALTVVMTGCWSEDLVDATFTREEWAVLSGFVLPEPDRCPEDLAAEHCDDAAELGHRLFFDKSISGAIAISDPAAPGRLGETGKISCASCHDSTKPEGARRRYFVDTRSQPGNVSSGAKYTRHNALSVVNVSYKSAVARELCAGPGRHPSHCEQVYSWFGAYDNPAGVLNLANGAAAMNTNGALMGSVICNKARYLELYYRIFGGVPFACASGVGKIHGNAQVELNVAIAFEAYVRRLDSVDAPFDRYIAGDFSALTETERRGLAVFVRDGGCVECHGGALFSDLQFRNTGVKQEGANVPLSDTGLESQTLRPEDLGNFLTPSLRNVAMTAPYMHAGQYNTLGEVIEFYRRGGDAVNSFTGTKDHRMQPLIISDADARDLEAFLGALTGREIDAALAEPLP